MVNCTENNSNVHHICSTDCDRPLDVAFLLDTGGSHWNTTLAFADRVTSQLSPSARGTHVAVLGFGTDPTILFGLTDQPDFGKGREGSTGFDNQTTGSPSTKDTGRDVAAAIRAARRSIFTNTNGDRPQVCAATFYLQHNVIS